MKCRSKKGGFRNLKGDNDYLAIKPHKMGVWRTTNISMGRPLALSEEERVISQMQKKVCLPCDGGGMPEGG